jgi:hypothetical protein
MCVRRESFCQSFQTQFATSASGAEDPPLHRLGHANTDNRKRYEEAFKGDWINGVVEQCSHYSMLIEPLAGNGEAGFVLLQKCGS